MKSLKHLNKTVCTDSVNVEIIQDIYNVNDRYIVISSKVKGGNFGDVDVVFDVFETLVEAECYVKESAVLSLSETSFSANLLDRLDEAYTSTDSEFESLVVNNTHLIKNAYMTEDLICVQHIEYANKCALSDDCVVISSCYVYKQNDEHWTKSAQTWRCIYVYPNVDSCASAAQLVVNDNNNQLQNIINNYK